MAEKGGGGEEPAIKRSRMEQVGEMILDQTWKNIFTRAKTRADNL